MSRKMIWFLTSFMVFAVALLILVQVYWIRNAILIKEQQFSQLVNRSLASITNDLQRRIIYDHIDREMSRADSIVESQLILPLESNMFRSQVLEFNSSGELKDDVSSSLPDTMSLSSAANYENNELWREKLIENILDRMLKQHQSVSQKFSITEVKEIIENYLINNGIKLDFEFALVKENRNIAMKTDGFNPVRGQRIFQTRISQEFLFVPAELLVVYFPAEESFIFSTIGLMIFSSAMLSIVIIAIFSATLFVIFRQKRLSEMKNDFVNNMTHELKTPISTISLASQMLADNSITNKNTDHLARVITDESGRLTFQVEKVLQTAAFDRGKIKLKTKDVDINDIVEQAVKNFSFQVRSRDGQIQKSIHAANANVKGDPVHLLNVVSNLLDNALKYSQDQPIIEVGTYDSAKSIFIQVKDYGIGISKSDQKKIFEKFYRVPTGDLHNVKGFGLGLHYVKKIIEEHHGNIKLISELETGTTFTISLPLKQN